MKQVLLIRHAKTIASGYDSDHERFLTDKGKEDCKLMRKRLSKISFKPELVLVSPAKRAKQTFKFLDFDKSIRLIEPKLYLANYHVLLYQLANLPEINCVAVIAHNPGLTDLFNFIGNAKLDNLPTCGMGLFNIDISQWSDIKLHAGKLEWYDWPKKD